MMEDILQLLHIYPGNFRRSNVHGHDGMLFTRTTLALVIKIGKKSYINVTFINL
jgi:hypothetical protein